MLRRPLIALMASLMALMMLQGAVFATAAEIDDSNLFVEAFNAYQKKDYLLAIDKVKQLNQLFPDTPLRDVSLLLLARSGAKSGDNTLAAKIIIQFFAEFPNNALRSSVEEELITLAERLQKGEKLPENSALKNAAAKVRNEQMALERAAAEKAERERLARLKAEQDRIAREKAETERRERERIAAEKAAKEGILAGTVITLESNQVVAAGQNGRLAFEIANRTRNSEEYILDLSASPEYGAVLSADGDPVIPAGRITIAAGTTFKGVVSFRMPADRVDGERKSITIRSASARFSDVVLSKDTLVIAAAPLVRVVARPLEQQVAPGGEISYRVSVLNIGSRPAQGLTVKAVLPPQLDYQETANAPFRLEGSDSVSLSVKELESGRIEEFQLKLKARKDSRNGQQLRFQVEVVNSQLQRKDIFSSSAATVKEK